jgi:hypothetical protein
MNESRSSKKVQIKVGRCHSYRADNPIMLNSTCGEAVPLTTLDLNEGSWKIVCGLSCMNLKYRSTSRKISSSPRVMIGIKAKVQLTGDVN